MATEIHVRGGSFEADVKFDTVRKNVDAAVKARIDFENGNIDGTTRGSEDAPDQRLIPFQRLTFPKVGGGKFAVNPMEVIALDDLDDE